MLRIMLLSDSPLQQSAREHLLLHFSRNGSTDPLLVLERGEGPYVFDTQGNRYLDGLSSLFCAQLGYSYGEELGSVAAAQLQQLAFSTVWGAAHPTAIELAETLSELMPGDLDHVFFTGGGSESVESAWKLVRHYHVANGEPQRTKAIARDIAYHGVTLGALSFTGVEKMKAPFGPPAIPVTHVSTTNAFRADDGQDEEAFCRRLLEEVEQTIQAEGPDTLVSDEVICGFGRLGEWLGAERYGVVPDLATTAKGLTSAYAPMGAVMVSDKIAAPLFEAERTLMHGITFAGHPLCAAIALRNLEIFRRDGILENVRAQEPHLVARLEELRALPIVGDVRGAGFFWAIELVKDDENTRLDADERERILRGYLPGRLLEAGLIARPDDRGDAVLHVAPPLISDSDVIDELAAKVGEVLTDAHRVLHGEMTP
jgi:adenosylmethionine-8-amino-7-oxononanoate aminotransferase